MKIYPLHMNISDTVSHEALMDNLISKVKNKESGLFLLPELFLSSYIDIHFSSLADLKKVLSPLLTISKPNDFAFVGSVPFKHHHQKYNTAILIRDGDIEFLYNKHHLYMHEREVFDRGRFTAGFFDCKGFKFAVQICLDVMDICHLKQKVVNDGIQVLLLPMATSSDALAPIIKSRSIELQVPIVTSNRFGNDKGILFNLPNRIFMPDGSVLQKDSLDLSSLDFNLYYHMRNKLDIT